MGINIKVVATGVVALCLVLSAVLYMQSGANPSMQAYGDKFFGLAIVLVFITVLLALVSIKIKLP